MRKPDHITGLVVEWIDQSPPRACAFLRNVADGDEFEWGDDELEEYVSQFLCSTVRGAAAGQMAELGIDVFRAREFGLRLERAAQEPPHWSGHADWEFIRNHLLEV